MQVDVALPLPIFQTFTYRLPDGLRPRPGTRVIVPLGKRRVTGIIVRSLSAPDQSAEIKPIYEVLDEEPLLSESLLELGSWISSYYFAPPGEALRVMLPPGLLSRTTAANGQQRRSAGWPVRTQMAVVELAPEDEAEAAKLTERQRDTLAGLRNLELPILLEPFIREQGGSRALFKALSSRQLVCIKPIEVFRSSWSAEYTREVKKHSLTGDQRTVFKHIESKLEQARFHTLLLHGITGSGKTEVYLNAIAVTLERGKSALMLVPEIGLTPQTADYFRLWFADKVAILHSALSDGQRFDQWKRIREGTACVVIGTRSALFAPLQKLGIIIVDEEHDASYKQEELPRYHARDTAVKRGQLEDVLVVLGSATPQLETFHRATSSERMSCLTLSSRVLQRSLPTVHIVDMRIEFQKKGKAAVLSDLLRDAIQDRLDRKEQVLILLNRRGYSTALLCRSCGHTESCRNCSISLTFHQETNRLSCHYCGYSRPVPEKCRECEKRFIYFIGEGTEKIQELLRELYPQAVVDRLDRDAVQRKGSFERILGAFARGRTDVLIGTQMVAKGHDFPSVTLVGVLSADQSLRLPDFRSAERTFQLLTQVAGRSGRGERPGEVIVQTYFPNHYSLKHARAQDYRLFYEQEIRFRRNFHYPPFTALANLLVQGDNREKTHRAAEAVTESLLKNRARYSNERRMRVLGPAPAAIERIKRRYRFQVLIKTVSRQELHQVIEKSVDDLQASKVDLKKITIDIDPVNLL